MASIPRPEHPNPQWERSTWRNLNGAWQFEIDHGVSGEAKAAQIDELCADIASELRAQGLSDSENVYLEPHAFAVQSGIRNREIRELHIMEG